MVCFIWFWWQTTAIGYVTKYGNTMEMRCLYLDILSFECLYFCIAKEQHWDGNRFECVSSVQCSKTKNESMKNKKISWEIKSLTNNNNNNNNNMTKAVYYQLVQCRRLSLSSFRIVAFVFLFIFSSFFIRPMEIWKRKWMQSRQHWIESRTWILM